jgi:hypothetical protein
MEVNALIHKIFLAMAGRYAGRDCRRCAEPIDGRNAFAQSEGVCPSCTA